MSLVSEDIYRSSNSDQWLLLTDTLSGQSMVRHQANLASGGKVTDLGVEEFLSVDGPGPEYAALRDLLRRREAGDSS